MIDRFYGAAKVVLLSTSLCFFFGWQALIAVCTHFDVFAPDAQTGQYRNGIEFGRYGRGAEDRVCVDEDLLREFALPRVRYYAVFDGHGGSSVATMLGRAFKTILAEELKQALQGAEGACHMAVQQAACRSFERAQAIITGDRGQFRGNNGMTSGSTAVIALIINGWLYIANAGDSPARLYDARTGQLLFASVDHDLQDPDSEEFNRVVRAITADNPSAEDRVRELLAARKRLDGLAVTRSLGDMSMRDGKLLDGFSCQPQCYEPIKLRAGVGYRLLLASDGLYEVDNASRFIPAQERARLYKEISWELYQAALSMPRRYPYACGMLPSAQRPGITVGPRAAAAATVGSVVRPLAVSAQAAAEQRERVKKDNEYRDAFIAEDYGKMLKAAYEYDELYCEYYAPEWTDRYKSICGNGAVEQEIDRRSEPAKQEAIAQFERDLASSATVPMYDAKRAEIKTSLLDELAYSARYRLGSTDDITIIGVGIVCEATDEEQPMAVATAL